MLSMFTATHAAVAAMLESGQGGSVINITSIEGSRAAPRCAVYAACKAGMINFTRTAAVELAEHNIRVNAIAPDHVDTPGIRGLNPAYFSEKVLAARARYIPMGRDGTLDDIGHAAVFLASNMASYITGTTLNVDGGTFASSGWVRGGETGWTLFPD
jgi:NAD(P)-dependent dehydrogenase (short-subunit alcohol dehydrogenase family)